MHQPSYYSGNTLFASKRGQPLYNANVLYMDKARSDFIYRALDLPSVAPPTLTSDLCSLLKEDNVLDSVADISLQVQPCLIVTYSPSSSSLCTGWRGGLPCPSLRPLPTLLPPSLLPHSHPPQFTSSHCQCSPTLPLWSRDPSHSHSRRV